MVQHEVTTSDDVTAHGFELIRSPKPLTIDGQTVTAHVDFDERRVWIYAEHATNDEILRIFRAGFSTALRRARAVTPENDQTAGE